MGKIRWMPAFGMESFDSLDGYRGWRIQRYAKLDLKPGLLTERRKTRLTQFSPYHPLITQQPQLWNRNSVA
jgi:hypothetical protein